VMLEDDVLAGLLLSVLLASLFFTFLWSWY
jgi:hypothetical protein